MVRSQLHVDLTAVGTVPRGKGAVSSEPFTGHVGTTCLSTLIQRLPWALSQPLLLTPPRIADHTHRVVADHQTLINNNDAFPKIQLSLHQGLKIKDSASALYAFPGLIECIFFQATNHSPQFAMPYSRLST
eukprot:552911-Amphidinium_carterae.1